MCGPEAKTDSDPNPMLWSQLRARSVLSLDLDNTSINSLHDFMSIIYINCFHKLPNILYQLKKKPVGKFICPQFSVAPA